MLNKPFSDPIVCEWTLRLDMNPSINQTKQIVLKKYLETPSHNITNWNCWTSLAWGLVLQLKKPFCNFLGEKCSFLKKGPKKTGKEWIMSCNWKNLCFIKNYFKSKDVKPVFVTKVKNVHEINIFILKKPVNLQLHGDPFFEKVVLSIHEEFVPFLFRYLSNNLSTSKKFTFCCFIKIVKKYLKEVLMNPVFKNFPSFFAHSYVMVYHWMSKPKKDTR